MSERSGKVLLAAEVLLLLLPLTSVTALLLFVSYPAYPLAHYTLLQFAFDLGMLLQVLGVASAWRLAASYMRSGPTRFRRLRGYLALLGAAAVAGFVGAMIALWHILTPESAPAYVGFALFAPGAALVPIWIHLLREYRGAAAHESARGVEDALQRN